MSAPIVERLGDAAALPNGLYAEAADTIADLLEALQESAEAEAEYRRLHDLKGAGDIETGRAWDRMRRAGNSARQAIASATWSAQ